MAQPFYLREQAGRCRRRARDSTYRALRDSLLKLADEYIARASASESALEDGDAATWQASPDRDDSRS